MRKYINIFSALQLESPRLASSLNGGYRRVRLGDLPALGQYAEALRERGAILPIQVGLPSSMAKGKPPEEIQAMIDTGASITAINVSAAQRIGLPVTGSARIGGVTGASDMPVYGALLRFPDPKIDFDPIPIAGATMGGAPFEMLIGRNILCRMLLSYDGKKGQFTLTI